MSQTDVHFQYTNTPTLFDSGQLSAELLDLESQKLAEGWPWPLSKINVRSKVMGQMARSWGHEKWFKP